MNINLKLNKESLFLIYKLLIKNKISNYIFFYYNFIDIKNYIMNFVIKYLNLHKKNIFLQELENVNIENIKEHIFFLNQQNYNNDNIKLSLLIFKTINNDIKNILKKNINLIPKNRFLIFITNKKMDRNIANMGFNISFFEKNKKYSNQTIQESFFIQKYKLWIHNLYNKNKKYHVLINQAYQLISNMELQLSNYNNNDDINFIYSQYLKEMQNCNQQILINYKNLSLINIDKFFLTNKIIDKSMNLLNFNFNKSLILEKILLFFIKQYL